MTPERIRAVRAHLGITQTEMARALGLGSKTRIAEYESGAKTPSASVLLLLVAYGEGRLPVTWPDIAAPLLRQAAAADD